MAKSSVSRIYRTSNPQNPKHSPNRKKLIEKRLARYNKYDERSVHEILRLIGAGCKLVDSKGHYIRVRGILKDGTKVDNQYPRKHWDTYMKPLLAERKKRKEAYGKATTTEGVPNEGSGNQQMGSQPGNTGTTEESDSSPQT